MNLEMFRSKKDGYTGLSACGNEVSEWLLGGEINDYHIDKGKGMKIDLFHKYSIIEKCVFQSSVDSSLQRLEPLNHWHNQNADHHQNKSFTK